MFSNSYNILKTLSMEDIFEEETQEIVLMLFGTYIITSVPHHQGGHTEPSTNPTCIYEILFRMILKYRYLFSYFTFLFLC